MPRFDKTGPANRGPKTGGQQGNCDNTNPKGRPFDGRGEGKSRNQTERGLGNRGQGFFKRFGFGRHNR